MLQGLEAGKLSWNYPSWSISVEFMAYLAFPLCAAVVCAGAASCEIRSRAASFCALGWLAFLKKGDFDQWDGPIALLRCLPEFLLGTLLYVTFRVTRVNSWLNGDAVLGIAVATILCLHFGAPDLLIVALFAALIPVAVVNAGRFAKVTNAGPLDLARRNLLFALPDPRVHPVCDEQGLERVRHPAPRCPVQR